MGDLDISFGNIAFLLLWALAYIVWHEWKSGNICDMTQKKNDDD